MVYLNDKNGDTVAPYKPRKVSKFTILDLALGYYDAPEEQEFLQPIYVFIGEATFSDGRLGRFYFYLPAIDYSIIQDAPPDTPSK